jgi:2-keto-myo-inositol isomerase
MRKPFTRRKMLASGLAAGVALTGTKAQAAQSAHAGSTAPAGFRYCLNTATIRGQKLPIAEVVAIAGKTGYDGIEPWIDELDQHVKDGKSLKDLGKQIADAGLTVESAIGFAEWIVDDPDRRARGLEEAKRTMGLVAEIDGKRIAAPPAGATDVVVAAAEIAPRYKALLEIGGQIGVVPQVELWGFSRTLNRLGDVVRVAIESGDPQACVLADVYHLYKGGSDYAGIRVVSNQAMHVFHFNDYPAERRAEITDAARVYPGDGVAPLRSVLEQLRSVGYRGVLSLELFNRDYWQQNPAHVARTGLEKMKQVVAASQT